MAVWLLKEETMSKGVSSICRIVLATAAFASLARIRCPVPLANNLSACVSSSVSSRCIGGHAMIADHRRHSFDAEIPLIKLLVLAGQLPALGHRRMLAQRRAAVAGAGRVALDQRRRERQECA